LAEALRGSNHLRKESRMSCVDDRYSVSVRSVGKENVVRSDLSWSDAQHWCKCFNKTMRGRGFVAVPHSLASLSGDSTGNGQVSLSVNLGAAEPGMSQRNARRLSAIRLPNFARYKMTNLVWVEFGLCALLFS
jgi:hypothetical protein